MFAERVTGCANWARRCPNGPGPARLAQALREEPIAQGHAPAIGQPPTAGHLACLRQGRLFDSVTRNASGRDACLRSASSEAAAVVVQKCFF